jgi:hypothetical protein
MKFSKKMNLRKNLSVLVSYTQEITQGTRRWIAFESHSRRHTTFGVVGPLRVAAAVSIPNPLQMSSTVKCGVSWMNVLWELI